MCSPVHMGHANLTSAYSIFFVQKNRVSPVTNVRCIIFPKSFKAIVCIKHLHLTARAVDSHATPDKVFKLKKEALLYYQGLVRFCADHRIKTHTPLLVWDPV